MNDVDEQKEKSYDTSYKLKAIERAEQSSKEAAVRVFGVDGKRICVWCRQKDKLPAMRKGKSPREGDWMELREGRTV